MADHNEEFRAPDATTGARHQKRTNTLACNECRRRRIKCGPYRPCQPCDESGKDCIQDDDGRRKEVKRRALEKSVIAPQQALISVIKILRGENKANIALLLGLLETGEPSQELNSFLEDRVDCQEGSVVQISEALIHAQRQIYRSRRSHSHDQITIEGANRISPQSTESSDIEALPAVKSPLPTNGNVLDTETKRLLSFQHSIHTIPSLAVPDGTVISKLFYGYRNAAREMIAEGFPVARVFGTHGRIDVDLFLRDRRPDDAYDVDSWACELLKKIDNFDFYVLLACCALCTSYMRWNILPTVRHYASMPPMIRPTQKQRLISHNMSIDLAPHPVLRDYLLQTSQDWLSLGAVDAGHIEIGWNDGFQAAVEVEPLTGRSVLTQKFIEHATNPRNWSMDASVRAVCPELEEMGFHVRS